MKFKTEKFAPGMEGLFGPSFPNTSEIAKHAQATIKANGCDYGIIIMQVPTAWCFCTYMVGFKPGSDDSIHIKDGTLKVLAQLWRFNLEYRLYQFGYKWNYVAIHFDLAAGRTGFKFGYEPKLDGLGGSDSAKHMRPGDAPIVSLKAEMPQLGREVDPRAINWLP